MTEGWFSKPVRIAIGVFGDEHNVSSARQALHALDSLWPDPGAPKFREARHFACARSMATIMRNTREAASSKPPGRRVSWSNRTVFQTIERLLCSLIQP